MTDSKTFPTRNDLPSEVRERMIGLLNQQLADTFDLYSQAKQAHAARYSALGATTRVAIDRAAGEGDAATADLFTEVARGLDKRLWFLEAHLQAGSGALPRRKDLALA
jgi:DNA-binding ferritin-like protein